MEEAIAVAAAWVLLLAYFAGRPAYIVVRERMSPKYAAARLKSWATEHPDDETAQAYLAQLHDGQRRQRGRRGGTPRAL